jgi:hypothetical protein
MLQTARLVSQPSIGALESANQSAEPEQVGFSLTPDLGRFHGRPSLETVAQARVAGRVNAAAVPDDEVKSLLAERAELLTKKFEVSLTKAENRRLQYIRWSLDRVEDARSGMNLDMLDSQVSDYESFLEGLKQLQDEISKIGA